MKYSNILGDGIGSIEFVDHLGSDLSVVNSARVSFGSSKRDLEDNDKTLINFLAKHNHTSPFRHNFITLRIVAPEFVMRQWYKHVIGCSWSTECINHGWNEISGRYTSKHTHLVHTPSQLRQQSKTNKQVGDIPCSKDINDKHISSIKNLYTISKKLFDEMIEDGVCKEQARMILPISNYTEVIWTASLLALYNFCKLRNHPESQKEIELYAKVIDQICLEKFPVSWNALRSDYLE